MRNYSLFLSAMLMFSLAYAQQANIPDITSTSTAEECVRFINQKLRTSIGMTANTGPTITDVQFTGGKYMYQVEFLSSINKRTDNSHTLYQTHVTDINWAAYKSVSAKQEDYYKALLLKIAMNPSHPVVTQSKYYHFQTGAQNGGYPAYKSDTLWLYFSMTEQVSVNALDKAFQRLSQIAKEKPDLFKSEAYKPKAIEGKASFNETLDFIYNNFPKQLSYYGSSYDRYGNFESSVDQSYKDFTVAQIHNTDSMIISWHDDFVVPKYLSSEEIRVSKKLAVVFSMKDIESLKPFNYTYLNGFVTLEKAREATFPCGITFYAKQGKSLLTLFTYNYKDGKASVAKVSGIYIPTSSYSNKENVETVLINIQNGQLYKAFNHLRNLCGAPDPLKFD